MTGRHYAVCLSRWVEMGGSYRTVQRFFGEIIEWPKLRWLLVKQHPTGTKGSAKKSRKDVALSPFQTHLNDCIRMKP